MIVCVIIASSIIILNVIALMSQMTRCVLCAAECVTGSCIDLQFYRAYSFTLLILIWPTEDFI